MALILEILDNDSKPTNSESKIIQIFSFNFFFLLLEQRNPRQSFLPNHSKIYLEEVYFFITGLKNVPVGWYSFKYRIKYQLNDNINRFCSLSNACIGVSQLALPIVENYKDRGMDELLGYSALNTVLAVCNLF
jgi:hypothetical protein